MRNPTRNPKKNQKRTTHRPVLWLATLSGLIVTQVFGTMSKASPAPRDLSKAELLLMDNETGGRISNYFPFTKITVQEENGKLTSVDYVESHLEKNSHGNSATATVSTELSASAVRAELEMTLSPEERKTADNYLYFFKGADQRLAASPLGGTYDYQLNSLIENPKLIDASASFSSKPGVSPMLDSVAVTMRYGNSNKEWYQDHVIRIVDKVLVKALQDAYLALISKIVETGAADSVALKTIENQVYETDRALSEIDSAVRH